MWTDEHEACGHCTRAQGWTRLSRALLIRAEAGGQVGGRWDGVEMTGFPYSEEGAITSIALGPLSSERWEPFLLVLSFTRVREKKKGRRKRKKTHTHKATAVIWCSQRWAVLRQQRSVPQPCLRLKDRLEVPVLGQTLDSSFGFENCHQCKSWQSPWTL